MTITYNTLYKSDVRYRMIVKNERLNTVRCINLLCPGYEYLETIFDILRNRGFSILDYDLAE